MSPRSAAPEWQPVCRFDDLPVDRGVAALVHGQAVAIFRLADDTLYALGNHDPFGRSPGLGHAMARGIVGVRAGVPFVASSARRRTFDLRTGHCLEEAHVSVPAYAVKVVDGVVQVGHRKADAA